jgi:hypothetical protein
MEGVETLDAPSPPREDEAQRIAQYVLDVRAELAAVVGGSCGRDGGG